MGQTHGDHKEWNQMENGSPSAIWNFYSPSPIACDRADMELVEPAPVLAIAAPPGKKAARYLDEESNESSKGEDDIIIKILPISMETKSPKF